MDPEVVRAVIESMEGYLHHRILADMRPADYQELLQRRIPGWIARLRGDRPGRPLPPEEDE